jgi:hypothetical protein
MENLELRTDYSAVIVNYSTGIDSTGTLFWAIKNYPKEKIWLVYCDTGLEYDINDDLVVRTATILGIKYVILRHEKGFLGILEHRQKFPDSSNRWCTSYLKRDVTDKWIRANRPLLGENVLFLTGERRDESPRRAKLLSLELHRTTLKTERKGKFTCTWHRPVLDFEKGAMFEQGKKLKLDPHPCYEYLERCSCIACIFMPDRYAAENMARYPEKFRALVQAELKYGHTWKQRASLTQLWQEVCEDNPVDLVV